MMRPECRQVRMLGAAYVDGELGAETAAGLAAHAAGCPVCAAHLGDSARLRAMLRQAGRSFAAPPELAGGVLLLLRSWDSRWR